MSPGFVHHAIQQFRQGAEVRMYLVRSMVDVMVDHSAEFDADEWLAMYALCWQRRREIDALVDLPEVQEMLQKLADAAAKAG